MKKYLPFFAFCLCMSAGFAQNNQWAWMGGEKNYTGVDYGIKGVADSANRPGTRYGSAYWKDASGNFWIFGGSGSTENTSGSLNDLWKYDPAKKWWTWVNGDSMAGQKAVYGVRGIAAPANKPGATEHIGGTADRTVSWKDASGNFWMYSNVLWKYTPSLNQWTWINGDTAVKKAVYGIKGVGNAANKPGSGNSVGWTDASGNFWLYGNVLWKYTVATDLWTWVHGDTINTKTVYGLKGIPSNTNTPGTRKDVTGWSDTSGKFWLFGGSGTVSTPFYVRLSLYYYDGNLNDLWNYDPGTNVWTWVGGDTVLHAPNVTGTIGAAAAGNRPGARSAAVSWTDSSGNFWLFGGSEYIGYSAAPAYYAYNDLWKYDRAGNLWTCFNNKSYISRDSFVVKRIESPYTKPSERYGGIGWTDTSGSLWMFGGTAEPTWPRMNDLLRYNPKTNLWALLQESSNGFGIYGLKGVANADNIPGGRVNAAGWTDSTGNFWLYGGYGIGNSAYSYLNDLWKKDTAGIWTWISGLTTPVPSGREYPTTWADASGSFWLFGGRGENPYYKNDMWKYDKNSDQWTQISGNANSRYGIKGRPDTANKPGSRYNTVSWKDNAGKLWLFGGGEDANNNGYYYAYNDVWNYDTTIHQWTWVSGDSIVGQLGVYGKKGVADAANKPRSREGAVSWTDNSNNVWIFGGLSNNNYYSSGYLNDLWKYNTVTNVWTWISGDNSANKNGVYGTKGIPDAANKPGSRFDAISWIDASGKLWLFGGSRGVDISYTQILMNDLWNYDPATNLWTWVSGDSSMNNYGIAGSRGMASAAYKPGARSGSVAWKDKSGNLWLMGGAGYGVKKYASLNDLWKFTLASPAALPVKFIYFNAAAQNNAVALNWNTAEEQHCAYYAIERSRDGVGYDSIGTLTATGNGHAVNIYSFIDHYPFSTINYYRIRQVDIDGKHTYTSVRKVMMNTAGFSYALGQNPVVNELRVYIQSGQPAQWQLEVRDATGHLLIRQSQATSRGTTTNVIPIKQLAAGTYFLTVTAGKTSITKKFIKQ